MFQINHEICMAGNIFVNKIVTHINIYTSIYFNYREFIDTFCFYYSFHFFFRCFFFSFSNQAYSFHYRCDVVISIAFHHLLILLTRYILHVFIDCLLVLSYRTTCSMTVFFSFFFILNRHLVGFYSSFFFIIIIRFSAHYINIKFIHSLYFPFFGIPIQFEIVVDAERSNYFYHHQSHFSRS